MGKGRASTPFPQVDAHVQLNFSNPFLYHVFRTQLFREFKLCKMLLRPLDDRHSASRYSGHMLRGYSRQTESYVSSLSNSVDNSANNVEFDDDNMEDTYGFSRSFLFKYKRPGSNAYSLPIKLGLGTD
jgi:hypothetical protein